MTERPKLKLTVAAPAEGESKPSDKTRGWNVSPARADKLKELARDMRRNPSEAEVLLWDGLKDKKCAGYSFTRQVVMGSTIVDFACRSRWLVVETGAASEADIALAELSDRKLTEVGVRVLRFSDDAILADVTAVLASIAEELQKPFDKPAGSGGQGRGDRGDRSGRPAPRGDRPGGGGRSYGDRSRGERPGGDRPYGDRPRGERSGDRRDGGYRDGGGRDGGGRSGGSDRRGGGPGRFSR